jgi:hypothetical protein
LLKAFGEIPTHFRELRVLLSVGTNEPLHYRNKDMKHMQATKSESLPNKSNSRGMNEKMKKPFVANIRENCSPSLVRVFSVEMLTKLLRMGVVGLMLCGATAWAGLSSIQGVVKDAKGQPIKGADVQVATRDGKQLFKTVKTDARGHYLSQELQPGVYRVSLVVNGVVKASITNTNTQADRATQLNFDLKPVSASQASSGQKQAKHMVWIPANTGSHLGGRWVEVDEGGAAAAGNLNVKRGSANALQQTQMQNAGGPNSFPGAGAVGNGSQ